jgi:hypothetical protein
MKGSMRQRGSAWELRVYLGADPVTGKQRYATKTVRAGKREANLQKANDAHRRLRRLGLSGLGDDRR